MPSVVEEPSWNKQCPAFTFPVPSGWRNLDEDELRTLSHLEGSLVRAAVVSEAGGRKALVHVTSCPGDLGDYVEGLLDSAWGRPDHATLDAGPFAIGVGGVEGVLLDYVCLEYSGDSVNLRDEPREDGLPDYMRLLLVVAEVERWLYLISLYTAEEDVQQRAPVFQSILDSWVWTPWAKLAQPPAATR